MNITELERLAKEAIPSTKRIGRGSPFREAANPQTILQLIEFAKMVEQHKEEEIKLLKEALIQITRNIGVWDNTNRDWKINVIAREALSE